MATPTAPLSNPPSAPSTPKRQHSPSLSLSEPLDVRSLGMGEDFVIDEMEANNLMAKALKSQGIQFAFGVVGVPVTPFAEAMQREGIKFIAMRNEQAASYAASVVGYLTQMPAVCLTVAGPGFVHALAGLLNAQSNCWPMILISSAAPTSKRYMGTFQEAEQMEAARPYIKFGGRVENASRFPFVLELAVRTSIYGRPGGCYIEIQREVFTSSVSGTISFPPKVSPPPLMSAHADDVSRALKVLHNSKKPLIVIGKGAAYSRAERELRYLSEARRFPVLPSSMAKGLLPDNHDNIVSAARSAALKEADAILLVGARLNWTFEFGTSPKFNPNCKIVQVETTMEQLHANRPAEVALVGDARTIVGQLLSGFGNFPSLQRKEWWDYLTAITAENKKGLEALCNQATKPMQYHYVLARIDAALPQGAVIVNEGANTMDVGRIVLSNFLPRSRLDAGTNGTMGVGVGYAIAAALVHRDRKVVTVQGDSAFGFSAMEVEVAVRYRLPITFIVLNNNGIYAGEDALTEPQRDPTLLPPTLLCPETRYDKLMEACGGVGYYVEDPEKLDAVLRLALDCTMPTVVNVRIDPHSSPMPSTVKQASVARSLSSSHRSRPTSLRSPMTNDKLAQILH